MGRVWPLAMRGHRRHFPGQGEKFSVDSGMIVVIFICLGYLLLVIGLLFFVKNDWCDLLFRNMTENLECRPKSYNKVGIMVGSDLINLSSKERRREWKRITSTNNQDILDTDYSDGH